MIYEINGKAYIKMINYYSQVKLSGDRFVPIEKGKKLFFSEVKGKVTEYSVEEYKKKSTRNHADEI